MSFTTGPVETGCSTALSAAIRTDAAVQAAAGVLPDDRHRLPDRLLLACRTGCCRTTLVVGTSSWGSGSAFARPSPRKPRFSVPSCPVSGVALGTLPDVAAGRDEVPVRAPLDALAALMRAAAAGDVRPVDVPLRAPLAALAAPAVLAVPVLLAAPLAWRVAACPDEPVREEPVLAELCAVRAGALSVALLAAAPIGSQFLNMKYCWPSVHRLVVTQ